MMKITDWIVAIATSGIFLTGIMQMISVWRQGEIIKRQLEIFKLISDQMSGLRKGSFDWNIRNEIQETNSRYNHSGRFALWFPHYLGL